MYCRLYLDEWPDLSDESKPFSLFLLIELIKWLGMKTNRSAFVRFVLYEVIVTGKQIGRAHV